MRVPVRYGLRLRVQMRRIVGTLTNTETTTGQVADGQFTNSFVVIKLENCRQGRRLRPSSSPVPTFCTQL